MVAATVMMADSRCQQDSILRGYGFETPCPLPSGTLGMAIVGNWRTLFENFFEKTVGKFFSKRIFFFKRFRTASLLFCFYFFRRKKISWHRIKFQLKREKNPWNVFVVVVLLRRRLSPKKFGSIRLGTFGLWAFKWNLFLVSAFIGYYHFWPRPYWAFWQAQCKQILSSLVELRKKPAGGPSSIRQWLFFVWAQLWARALRARALSRSSSTQQTSFLSFSIFPLAEDWK